MLTGDSEDEVEDARVFAVAGDSVTSAADYAQEEDVATTSDGRPRIRDV